MLQCLLDAGNPRKEIVNFRPFATLAIKPQLLIYPQFSGWGKLVKGKSGYLWRWWALGRSQVSTTVGCAGRSKTFLVFSLCFSFMRLLSQALLPVSTNFYIISCLHENILEAVPCLPVLFLADMWKQPWHSPSLSACCPRHHSRMLSPNIWYQTVSKSAAVHIMVSSNASTVKTNDRKFGSHNRYRGQKPLVQIFHTVTSTIHFSERTYLWEHIMSHSNS